MTDYKNKAVVIHGSSSDWKDIDAKKLLKKFGKKNLIVDWDNASKLNKNELALTRSAPHLISDKYHKIDINVVKREL